MPIKATVVLDSGCFLRKQDGDKHADIGYFQCAPQTSDIRVFVDGVEKQVFEKLGGKIIGVLHKDAKGNVKKDGVTASKTFHDSLLHMKDLYGKDIEVDRDEFDCIIHFDSGDFNEAKVKKRRFKESAAAQSKETKKPIAHDVEVSFTLADGEELVLTSDGQPFLSSSKFGAKKDLEIRLVCDDATAVKFYRDCFKYPENSYWLPNQGDPPPVCPRPPCTGDN